MLKLTWPGSLVVHIFWKLKLVHWAGMPEVTGSIRFTYIGNLRYKEAFLEIITPEKKTKEALTSQN